LTKQRLQVEGLTSPTLLYSNHAKLTSAVQMQNWRVPPVPRLWRWIRKASSPMNHQSLHQSFLTCSGCSIRGEGKHGREASHSSFLPSFFPFASRVAQVGSFCPGTGVNRASPPKTLSIKFERAASSPFTSLSSP